MIGEYNQFIAKYKDVLTPQECESLIIWGEEKIPENDGIDHNELIGRKDTAIFMQQFRSGKNLVSSIGIPQKLTEYLDSYSAYYECYPYRSKDMAPHSVYNVKWQKSTEGGGFTNWHCEINENSFNRFGVWMIYLNDCDGKTDFYFQKTSYTPVAGTLLIFPATWTHTHRANPDITEDKYIITGWYEFPR